MEVRTAASASRAVASAARAAAALREACVSQVGPKNASSPAHFRGSAAINGRGVGPAAGPTWRISHLVGGGGFPRPRRLRLGAGLTQAVRSGGSRGMHIWS